MEHDRIDGARVLVLAHIFGQQYLNSFLRYAQRNSRWILGIVADKPFPHFCPGLDVRKEDYFLLPDAAAIQDWERDEKEFKRVSDLVADCERATYVPVNRLLLADERNSGRGYGREFYHWPSNTDSRATLRDNSLPERYAVRWFKFAEQVLDQFRPALVIIGGQISTPQFFAFTLLAARRGLPFTISRPSKILSNRCFWTSNLEMWNGAGRELCEQKIRSGIVPRNEAYNYIREFRSRPIEVAYIQRINQVVARRGLLSRLRGIVWVATLHTMSRLGKPALSGRKKPIVSRVAHEVCSYWLTVREKRFFKTFANEDLERISYIYIALHKEPELALNFQAPLWHNQKNLIAWLSKNLPIGYRLFVRDHHRNRGRRPVTFYRDLLAYPGVDLISPFDTQFKYIRNADLIISDNGTTGWEGLIFGKRVISLARNFWEPAGLAKEVNDPSRLGEIIIRRLSEPTVTDPREWDRRLACLVEAEMETTVPEDDSSHKESLSIVASLIAHPPKKGAGMERPTWSASPQNSTQMPGHTELIGERTKA